MISAGRTLRVVESQPQPTRQSNAMLFDVQRFSIHDGPGIRTTLFFKGCSLDCAWCQNPESKRPGAEIAYYAERCTDCGGCDQVCPNGALTDSHDQRIDWELCDHCGLCVDGCGSGALRRIGESWSLERLLEAALSDREFAESSGGGVTLSGGEPVLHSAFLQHFLPLLKEQGVHVLLQTAGNYPWRLLEPLLPFVDEVYFDWKLAGDDDCQRFLGRSNQRIRENLRRLVSTPITLTVRTPLIPGINTADDQLALSASQLRELGVEQLTLLRYNGLWESKLPRLQTEQRALNLAADVDYPAICGVLREAGITPHTPD